MSFREGAEGLEWRLISPMTVPGVETQGYRLDVTVRTFHSLGRGGARWSDDLPQVIGLENIEHLDGGPSLNLDRVARDAIVSAVGIGWFEVRRPGEEIWQPPTAENWRETAEIIRAVYGLRLSWTRQLDDRLVEMVEHIDKHGCGTVTDIAKALGTTSGNLHTRIGELRNRGRDIPELRQGRPPSQAGS